MAVTFFFRGFEHFVRLGQPGGAGRRRRGGGAANACRGGGRLSRSELPILCASTCQLAPSLPRPPGAGELRRLEHDLRRAERARSIHLARHLVTDRSADYTSPFPAHARRGAIAFAGAGNFRYGRKGVHGWLAVRTDHRLPRAVAGFRAIRRWSAADHQETYCARCSRSLDHRPHFVLAEGRWRADGRDHRSRRSKGAHRLSRVLVGIDDVSIV